MKINKSADQWPQPHPHSHPHQHTYILFCIYMHVDNGFTLTVLDLDN